MAYTRLWHKMLTPFANNSVKKKKTYLQKWSDSTHFSQEKATPYGLNMTKGYLIWVWLWLDTQNHGLACWASQAPHPNGFLRSDSACKRSWSCRPSSPAAANLGLAMDRGKGLQTTPRWRQQPPKSNFVPPLGNFWGEPHTGTLYTPPIFVQPPYTIAL